MEDEKEIVEKSVMINIEKISDEEKTKEYKAEAEHIQKLANWMCKILTKNAMR